ncbi:MAG: hypothetical protein FWE10_03265 [Rikenellaceae bacterium]|nr:hypothetical protein [Rikenellaceae bacterium]MCL2693179.1 hypothetical protein [Rikenellaceae bacterium]
MDNKLQELTRKLYDEGLSRGRQQAELMLEEAQAQARKIVEDAWAEAKRIEQQAERKAKDLHKNTLTELDLAGKQAITKLRHAIRDMVVAYAVDGTVAQVTLDPSFVRDVLIAVTKNWQGTSQEHVTLRAMLPEAMRGRLDSDFEKSVRASLGSDIEIVFSNDIKSGFRIAPAKGGYRIDFTDKAFDALLGEYLRPRASDMLFGDEK